MAKRKSPGTTVSKRIQEAVLNHPETVEVEIGGKKMLFLLCGRGAKLAREKGKDPIPAIFKTLARIAPAIQKTGLFVDGVPDEAAFTPTVILNVLQEAFTGQLFDDLITVVWWGVLAAQPTITLEEIEVLVTPAGLKTLTAKVWPKMLAYAQDLDEADVEADSDEDDEGTEGN